MSDGPGRQGRDETGFVRLFASVGYLAMTGTMRGKRVGRYVGGLAGSGGRNRRRKGR